MLILFHLALLGIDLVFLALLRRRRHPAVFALLLLAHGVTSLALAIALSSFAERDAVFVWLRLAAHAVTFHVPALLAAGAVLLGSRARITARLAVAAGALIVAIAAYASWIEPYWLEVTRIEIASPKIVEPLRIAVLADLQADRLGAHERRALERLATAGADLMLLSGDYLQIDDPARRQRVAADLGEHLRRIGFQAPLGIYATRGDVDRHGWQSIFANTSVLPIEETTTFDVGQLRLTALSLIDSRLRDLEVTPSDHFHVVFGHAPDFALARPDADLLVAGHTHGGQVRLPFYGPPLTFSAVPRSWAAGVTRLESGAILVVSRGVGLERGRAPRLRFLCRPQIVVLDLVQKRSDPKVAFRTEEGGAVATPPLQTPVVSVKLDARRPSESSTLALSILHSGRQSQSSTQ